MTTSRVALNPVQQQVVEHISGPLLVLAGAGSGKTRVITQRIARLVERGIAPESIVALTFTNKAASEMASRVEAILSGRRTRGLTLSTFHSFGLQILMAERNRRGAAFTIFDQGDALSALKEILAQVGADRAYDAQGVLARISNAKNAFVAPDAYVPRKGDEYDAITAMVYPRYVEALRGYCALDFDDLVCEVARLWMDRPDILARWADRYRYILVDEYQDTNRAQLEVLRLLAGSSRNLCVVGDDDQSIYGWRGADVTNILAFEEHFPGARVIALEQNYRSLSPILAVANAVIAKRVDAKYRKILFTDRPGGEKVKSALASNPEAEAAFVARGVGEWVTLHKKAPREIAVLYRSNRQARLVEEALREHGVAYRVIGGQTFFERKEVKDVLAYMKLALGRADEISLRRIINTPPRGIGASSLELLATNALARGWSLWQAVERVDAIDGISNVARAGCKALEELVTHLERRLVVERAPPSAVARDLSERVGLRRELDRTSPTREAAVRRWSNVEALMGTLTRRERQPRKDDERAYERSLATYFHLLTLHFGEEEEAHNVVTLSTLHGAKGLEFDVVYLIGCEEGLLPHTSALEENKADVTSCDLEEERRLFYVGITRARDHLVLSRVRARALRGQLVPRTPSRFLLEIPEDLLEDVAVEDASRMSTQAIEERADALLKALDALG